MGAVIIMRKRHLAVCGLVVALGVSSLTACGTKRENTTATGKSTEISTEVETVVEDISENEKSETDEDVIDTAVDTETTGEAETVIIEGFKDSSVPMASADQIKEFNGKNPYFDVNADAVTDQDVTLVEYCVPGTDDIVYGAVISTKQADTKETDAETEVGAEAGVDGEMDLDFDAQAASVILGYRNSTDVTKDQFIEIKNKVGEGDALTKDDIMAWGKLFAAGMNGLDTGEDSIVSGSDFDFSDDAMTDISDEDLAEYASMYTNRKVSGVPFVQLGVNFLVQMNIGTSVADNDTAYALYEMPFGGSQNLNDMITFKDAKKHYKSDTIAEIPETGADTEESAEDLNIRIEN